MADPGTSLTHPYTCLSCSLAFTTATAQRDHYQTDLHRYNSKRRVAGLNPVSIDLFNEKVKERTIVTGPNGTPDGYTPTPVGQEALKLNCKACNKTFNTLATQTTHELSKKHREAVFRAASNMKVSDLVPSSTLEEAEAGPSSSPILVEEDAPSTSTSTPIEIDEPTPTASTEFESSGDPKLDLLIAKRLLSFPPIPPTTCLFCAHYFASPVETAAHMRLAHSFAIPEEEYLVDLEGLLRRLGEEVGTWNVCICCGKGYGGNINLDEEEVGEESKEDKKRKASRGVEAVRNHMQSKSHCKLRYDTEAQRLDLADFYDFRPSYPDYVSKQDRKAAKKAAALAASAAEGWEDDDAIEEDDEGHEVVYEDASSESDLDDDDDALPPSEITYGDSTYELVLPSGARLGHRAHAYIHKQNLAPYLDSAKSPFKPSAHSSPKTTYKPSPHSATLLQLVPRIEGGGKRIGEGKRLAEAGLVPARGGGVGGNGDVIRARNKGEAKEAGKELRQFKAIKAFNDQSFIRGVKANSQKHYRDHLLQ